MSATDNKQLVRDIFAQLALGNTRPLVDAMADEFRWVFPGSWSWSGTWEPKRVVVNELLGALRAQFDGQWTCHADLILADSDRVVVQAHGRVNTTRGDRYHQTYCFLFTVTDGQLVEVVEHCDTALVERVLERPVAKL